MDLHNRKAAHMVLVVLFAGALLYLNFATSFVPLSHRALAAETDELQQRYASITEENSRARAAAARLPLMRREAERLEQQWVEAQKLLPETTEMDALLREISLRGQENGVEFVLFRPASPIVHEFHTEHPIEMRIEGGFDQITGLLRDVASMRRIVSVRDLNLEQIPPSEESPYTARAQFVAVAYTLGGSPAARQTAAQLGNAQSGGDQSANVQVGNALRDNIVPESSDENGVAAAPRAPATGSTAQGASHQGARESAARSRSAEQPSFGRSEE